MSRENLPRVGVCVLPDVPWSEAKEIWPRVEAMGAAHGWTYDHLTWAGLADSPWRSTFPILTAAALVTENLPLGTFVASPNFRHPALLAKDAVTLDEISGGRFLLGIGAGGDVDSRLLGDDHTRGERTRRFAEFTGLLQRMLTEDPVSHDGEFYQVTNFRGIPGSVQQPHVPLIIAANGPRAIRLAATAGDGWVTTGPPASVLREHSLDPAQQFEAWWAGLAERSALVSEAEATHRSKDAKPLARYLSLDAGGPVALQSLEFAREQVARAGELGFTDVIVHWPRQSPPYQAEVSVLEALFASL